MPEIPHIEEHFTASEVVRDVVIGMSDGLTVPFALAAGLSGAAVATGDHAGTFDPLPLSAIAEKAGRTGGPMSCSRSSTAPCRSWAAIAHLAGSTAASSNRPCGST